MRTIEQTGKNVEEATRRALEALGASESEVEIEVLEGGSRGFFGLHATEARVRVTRRAPPDTTTDALAAAAPEAVEPAGDESEAMEIEDADEGREPALAKTQGKNAGEVVREVLSRILSLMGLKAEVALSPQPDGSYRLEVTGEEMDVVIGRHGNTINALQYLVGLIAHNRLGQRVRVVIDTEGYRQRREETLRELARAYAKQVKETGQEAVLDALTSFERRIIHTALAGDPDVTTYSEGEEPDRRVVITPREVP